MPNLPMLAQAQAKGETMIPRRIQRKRTKGWRMRPHTKCVSRGTKWGNPYRVMQDRDGFWWVVRGQEAHGQFARKESAMRCATHLFETEWMTPERRAEARKELRGWNLCDWCPLPKRGQPDLCHGTILLAISNAD